MNIYQVLVISISVVTTGCSHMVHKKPNEQQITIDILNSVKPGLSTSDEVRKLLGTPGEVMKLEQAGASRESGEVWEYFENGVTRASITVGADKLVDFGLACIRRGSR